MTSTNQGEACLRRDRNAFRLRLVDGLRAVPGAIALHEFGSATRNEHDGYSDIDLQVVSEDPLWSWAHLIPVLQAIQPIAAIFAIIEEGGSVAASVVFRDIAPWHKLDIGTVDCEAFGRKPLFAGARELWDREPKWPDPEPVDLAGLTPGSGSPAHVLLGDLIGSTRYAKYRLRGRQFVSRKFVMATLQRRVQLAWFDHVDDRAWKHGELSAYRWERLDAAVPASVQRDLLTLIPFDDDAAGDAATIAHLRQFADTLSRHNAISPDLYAFATRHITWLEHTLSQAQ